MKDFNPQNQAEQIRTSKQPWTYTVDNSVYVVLKTMSTLDVSDPAPYAKTKAWARSPRSLRTLQLGRGTILKIVSRKGKFLTLRSKDGWTFVAEKYLFEVWK